MTCMYIYVHRHKFIVKVCAHGVVVINAALQCESVGVSSDTPTIELNEIRPARYKLLVISIN